MESTKSEPVLVTLEEFLASIEEELHALAKELAASGSVKPAGFADGVALYSKSFFNRVLRIEAAERARIEGGEIRTTTVDPDLPAAPGYKSRVPGWEGSANAN